MGYNVTAAGRLLDNLSAELTPHKGVDGAAVVAEAADVNPLWAGNVKETWTGYGDSVVASTIVHHRFVPKVGGGYTEYTRSWKYNASGQLLEITEWVAA